MVKILIIDEDNAMRVLIGEWLAAEGHEVLLRGHVGNMAEPGVALVLADVSRPRGPMDVGLRRLVSLYPRAARIGLSAQLGRSLPRGAATARVLGLDRLLAKPCTREEVLEAVADSIGAAHG